MMTRFKDGYQHRSLLYDIAGSLLRISYARTCTLQLAYLDLSKSDLDGSDSDGSDCRRPE